MKLISQIYEPVLKAVRYTKIGAAIFALLCFTAGYGQIHVQDGTSFIVSKDAETSVETQNETGLKEASVQNARIYILSEVGAEDYEGVVYQKNPAENNKESKTLLAAETSSDREKADAANQVSVNIAKLQKREKPIVKVRLNSVPGNSSMAASAFTSAYGISSAAPSWAVRPKNQISTEVIPDWITKDLDADFKNEFYSSFYKDVFSVRPPPFIG